MASPKQSTRQLQDAAVAVIQSKGTDDLATAKPTTKRTHTRPEGFKGDRPGFFRGARIK